MRFVDEFPHDIVKRAAEEFGVSRQAVHRHLTALVREGQVEASGQARRKRYGLKVQVVERVLPFAGNQDEERVWRSIVAPVLSDLPESILRICDYGFTEMYNNAIEHSEGTTATVRVCRSASRASRRLARRLPTKSSASMRRLTPA
jgi:DNA-binding IclR family transcriptional regulator